MKTLYIIRHAESNRIGSITSDYERTLSMKGKKDILLITNKLIELDFNPDQVICSSSKRTVSTAQLICTEINYPLKDIIFKRSIYESSVNTLISLINSLPNNKNEIAILGHNPSITELSNYLTDELIVNMPTSSIIKIELEIDNWNEIIRGIGIQRFFINP
jgi:phosphohistidine phosphatase